MPQNLPQSTVTDPVAIATPGISQTPIGRDPVREQQALAKLGVSPIQAQTLDPVNLMKMVYTDQELANIPEFQALIAQGRGVAGSRAKLDEAGQRLDETQTPDNSTIRVLENILRAKKDPGQQDIGQSEIFKAAGLTGHATMMQSLNARRQEMKLTFDSFTRGLKNISGVLLDNYTKVADNYDRLRSIYDTEVERLDTLGKDIADHEQAIELLNIRHKNDLALASFKAGLQRKSDEIGDKISIANTPAWMDGLVKRFRKGLIPSSEVRTLIKDRVNADGGSTADADKFKTLFDDIISAKELPEGVQGPAIFRSIEEERKFGIVNSSEYIVNVLAPALAGSKGEPKETIVAKIRAAFKKKGVPVTAKEANSLYNKVEPHLK